MTFHRTNRGHVAYWRPDPDDATAHAWLLRWLADELHLEFRPKGSPPLSNSVRGNLGEAITFRIGRTFDYPGVRAFAPNAIDPLQEISRAGIDVMWVVFGEGPDTDAIVIHEVKTTRQVDLGITGALKDDVEKLFGTNPRLTLPARVEFVANDYEFLQNDPGTADRVRSMTAHSPATADHVSLVPTLVHDASGRDPEAKLLALLIEIRGMGWSDTRTRAWSIVLNDLDEHLQRLSEGG